MVQFRLLGGDGDRLVPFESCPELFGLQCPALAFTLLDLNQFVWGNWLITDWADLSCDWNERFCAAEGGRFGVWHATNLNKWMTNRSYCLLYFLFVKSWAIFAGVDGVEHQDRAWAVVVRAAYDGGLQLAGA